MEYNSNFHEWPEKDKKKFYRKLTLWNSRTIAPIFNHDELEPIMATINFFPLLPGRASTNSLMKELGTLTGTESEVRENDNVNVEELGENLQEDKPALTESDTIRVQWREYEHRSTNLIRGSGSDPEMRVLPRLPYPRVDGLHLMSYLAFLSALECYIDPSVVVNMFHISPMPMDSRDDVFKTVYEEMAYSCLEQDPEGPVLYFYRGDTLIINDASEEIYGRLKASVGNKISKMYLRKDGMRKIEEDERDDSSDFVCLIDDEKVLCGDGDRGELCGDESLDGVSNNLRSDHWENDESCSNFCVVNLSDLIGGGKKKVRRAKRTVVNKSRHV